MAPQLGKPQHQMFTPWCAIMQIQQATFWIFTQPIEICIHPCASIATYQTSTFSAHSEYTMRKFWSRSDHSRSAPTSPDILSLFVPFERLGHAESIPKNYYQPTNPSITTPFAAAYIIYFYESCKRNVHSSVNVEIDMKCQNMKIVKWFPNTAERVSVLHAWHNISLIYFDNICLLHFLQFPSLTLSCCVQCDRPMNTVYGIIRRFREALQEEGMQQSFGYWCTLTIHCYYHTINHYQAADVRVWLL